MWEDEHCNNPSKSPFFWRDWWHYYLHLLFFPPPQVWTKSEQPSNVSRSHPILSRLCSKSSNDRCKHYSHLLLKSAIQNVCWSVLLPSSRAVAEILLRLREKIMYSKLTNDQMMERRINMDEAPSSRFCPTWKFPWVNPNSSNRYSSLSMKG